MQLFLKNSKQILIYPHTDIPIQTKQNKASLKIIHITSVDLEVCHASCKHENDNVVRPWFSSKSVIIVEIENNLYSKQ